MNFERRLLFGFAGLLALAMLVAGIAVSLTSSARIERATIARLDVGAAVLKGFLEGRLSQLANSVRVLSNDFGFRAAVASHDNETLRSVLVNHGRRIEADLLAITSLEGELVASTDTKLTTAELSPFAGLLKEARSRQEATTTLVWHDSAYQVIARTVRAPDPIALVFMGFALDGSVAGELRGLAQLEVSFLVFEDAKPTVTATTHPGDGLAQALDAISSSKIGGQWRNEHFLGRLLPLADSSMDTPGPMALLQAATNEIRETQRLVVTQLVLILLVTLALSLCISVWLARRMGDPIAQLIAASRRIRSGDYSEPVALEAAGELTLLGDAMNVMARDIEDREQKIREQAYIEATTGLPNKLALMESLSARVQTDSPFALILLSLVNSREISLNLGFEVSEGVQRVAAQRLKAQVRDVDALFALQGDEFALVLSGVARDALERRVSQLVAELAQNYEVDRWSVSGRSAAGLIAFPEHGRDPQQLMRGVETTLEQAIANEEHCRFYVPGQEDHHERQLRIISDLEPGFAEDQFQLWFQPKIDLKSGIVRECEALIRWIHPELGFVPPGEFVELAERAGKMSRLTDFVLQHGIACAAAWQNHLPMRVAMNLSALDLAQPDLAQRVAATMGRHSAEGAWLALEVTESAVLRDAVQASQMLEQLRALGICLSIDDYGTGYSSLSQLKQLPVDELKIDMSFIRELNDSPDDAVIVKSTIELGHSLGLKVVAEGVENDESRNLLTGWGCDKAQGYFFSKPLPEDEFLPWCTSFNEKQRKVLHA